MPWYGWLILALALLVILAALTLRILRASRRGRRFLALSTRAKVDFGRTLISNPNVPILDKVALGILVGYLALPFDLIPDFIPVIGQLDDFVVVSLALLLLIKTIPTEVFDAALAAANERDEAREAAGRAIDRGAQATPPPPTT